MTGFLRSIYKYVLETSFYVQLSTRNRLSLFDTSMIENRIMDRCFAELNVQPATVYRLWRTFCFVQKILPSMNIYNSTFMDGFRCRWHVRMTVQEKNKTKPARRTRRYIRIIVDNSTFCIREFNQYQLYSLCIARLIHISK